MFTVVFPCLVAANHHGNISSHQEPLKSRGILDICQMGAIETNFDEVFDIFKTGRLKGLSWDSVEKIPKIRITNKNVDASGERICSVCLQDFQRGETFRSLLYCHHIFHLPCIDKWLVKQGSCPLCRWDL